METITNVNLWTQPPILAAIVAGSVSLCVALWSSWRAYKLQIQQQKSQAELEHLKHELAKKKTENDARLEYEFEARKKLYQEYEPLLFQLMEASENAHGRIRSLARTARNGNLGADGWLGHFGYYSKSTIYNLIVPLAIYRIMQRKITLVDLNVDKSITLLYRLVKQAYRTFMDEYKFAGCNPKLEYDGDHKEGEKRKQDNEKQYWKQGLPMGILDKTIEYIIDEDSIISYGEFERKLSEDKNKRDGHDLYYTQQLILRFHPETRPVLWRLLIGQALIYKALLQLKNKDHANMNENSIKLELGEEELKLFFEEFKWSEKGEGVVETEYKAALEYMAKHYYKDAK